MSGPLPTRRRLLAGGLLAATATTAGCLGFFDEDESGDGDTRRLELSMHRRDGTLRESRVADANDPPERWADGALAAAIDDEAFTTQNRKPFFATPDDPVYVRQDDTYYELGSVVVDEATETFPVLRLYTVEGDEETPDGVPTESLPEGDRRALEIAHMAARARGNEGGMPVGLVERDGYVYRNDQAITDSRLLGTEGPDHVTFRDSLYSIEVTGRRFTNPSIGPRRRPLPRRQPGWSRFSGPGSSMRDFPPMLSHAMRGRFSARHVLRRRTAKVIPIRMRSQNC